MKISICSIITLCLIFMEAFPQGISDSLFEINQVNVLASHHFRKENAGMKETRIDSMVLMEKINLGLSDLLSENTTVYIKDYGRGALSSASFRGTAPTHTQVSWNGININSPMLGMVDFSLIPMFIIDDISLQHGNSSIAHNSGGLGGHININNTVDWTNRFSARYYQGIGSFSTFDEFGQVNAGTKKFQSKTRAYHSYSKNDYKYINKNIFNPEQTTSGIHNNYPVQRNKNSDYLKYGAMQEFYYTPSVNWMLSAKAWYQNASRSIPTVMSDESNNTSSYAEELLNNINTNPYNEVSKNNRQDNNTLKAVIESKYYEHNMKTKFHSGIDHQQLDYKMVTQVSGFGKDTAVNSGSKIIGWYNNYSLDYDFNDNISANIKADYNHFDISTMDSVKQTGYDVTRNELSILGGTYVNLFKKINLSFMLRKDWIPNINTPVIYSLGTSYKPFKSHGLVYDASFARNFHNPTLNDMYWQPGGNPDLLPEKGHTIENGLTYRWNKQKTKFESQVSGYYSNINNWILWLPGFKGYWEPVNIKMVTSYGMECMLKMSKQINKINIHVQGNYAYTRSVNKEKLFGEGDESEGKQLPFIPVHSGNVFIKVTTNGYFINYQHNSYGVRNLLSSNRKGFDDDSDFFGLKSGSNPMYQLYPYHMNHLSFGKSYTNENFRLGVELKIHNLLNEQYRNILNRFMPQRNYTLVLKFNF